MDTLARDRTLRLLGIETRAIPPADPADWDGEAEDEVDESDELEDDEPDDDEPDDDAEIDDDGDGESEDDFEGSDDDEDENVGVDPERRHRQLLLLGIEVRDVPPIDERSAFLAEALRIFDGLSYEDRRAANWHPIDHPRYPDKAPGGKGGEFRPTIVSKVLDALSKWARGEGPDNPLSPDLFERAHLVKAAKERGLTVPPRAKYDDIADLLVNDVRGLMKDRVRERPSAKFTLQHGEHAGKDVAVYRDKAGKPALFPETDSGRRAKNPIATFDSLGELQAWADERGESHLADWARGESAGRGPAKVAKKAAPAKRAAPKASKYGPATFIGDVAKDLSIYAADSSPTFRFEGELQGRGGRTPVPPARVAQHIDDWVNGPDGPLAGAEAIAAGRDWSGAPGDPGSYSPQERVREVAIARQRAANWTEVARRLRGERRRKVTVDPLTSAESEGQSGAAAARLPAAPSPSLPEEGGGRGAKAVKKAAPRKAAPSPTGAEGLSADPSVREVQIENRIRSAYGERPQSAGGWVGLADLRLAIGGDLDRAEVDAALLRLAANDKGVRLGDNDLGGRYWGGMTGRPGESIRPTQRDFDAAMPHPSGRPIFAVAFGGDAPTADGHHVPPLAPLPAPSPAARKAVPGKAAPKAKSLMSQMTADERVVARDLGLPDDHPLLAIAQDIDEAPTRAEAQRLIADVHSGDLNQVAKELGIQLPPRMSADDKRAHIVQSVISFGNAGSMDARPVAPNPDGLDSAGAARVPGRVPPGQNSWSGHDGIDVTDEEQAAYPSLPNAQKAELDTRLKSGTSWQPGGQRGTFFGTHPDRNVEVSPQRHAEIRAAIEGIAYRDGTRYGTRDQAVTLQAVREGLADRFPRVEVDNVIQAMNRTSDWNVIPEVNQKVLTPRERLAAVVIGNQDKHAIIISKRGPAVIAEPTPAKAAAKRAPASRPPARPVAVRDLFDGDDATIEAALRDVYEGKFGPYTTKVKVYITRAGTRTDKRGRVHDVEPSIGVDGKIYDSKGNEVGYFGRGISPTTFHYPDGTVRREIWARHDIVQLGDADDKTAQGKGFGGEFNRRAIEWYRSSGIHGISQNDHNGYVWASQGFGFGGGGKVPDYLADNMRQLVADLRAGKTTSAGAKDEYATIPKRFRDAPDLEQQIAAAEALLSRVESGKPGDPGYPTAYEISQLGRRQGQRGKAALWLGKLLWVSADEMMLNPNEGEVLSP